MNWQRVLREESMAGINEWPRRDAAERLRQWPRIMGLAGAVSSPPFLGVVLLGSFARGEAEARRDDARRPPRPRRRGRRGQVAQLVRAAGADDLADRLERAVADEVNLLALSLDDRAIMLSALEDPPRGLTELRGLL